MIEYYTNPKVGDIVIMRNVSQVRDIFNLRDDICLGNTEQGSELYHYRIPFTITEGMSSLIGVPLVVTGVRGELDDSLYAPKSIFKSNIYQLDKYPKKNYTIKVKALWKNRLSNLQSSCMNSSFNNLMFLRGDIVSSKIDGFDFKTAQSLI